MNEISGIYKITNTLNDKVYIGSSSNIRRRFIVHKSQLRNNKHHNLHLQRSYNKYGAEVFKYSIVEECDSGYIHELESMWITRMNSRDVRFGYNIGSVGGGDNTTLHPNKEDIYSRISKTVNLNMSKLSEVERKKLFGRSGEENGNWKNGASKKFCECGNRKGYGAKSCSSCRDRHGENNPFYGSVHSDETVRKIAEANKGRLPPNTKKVQVGNICFRSISDAGRFFGKSVSVILYRIRSKILSFQGTCSYKCPTTIP